jgi:serine/threonine protein kinase
MNILLDKDGHCKLADFGVCEVGMFPGSRIAGFNGTYGYMAPEVIIMFYKCDCYTFCRVILLLYEQIRSHV